MSSHIVTETLGRVLQAPVNLFFDVTPIGQIINIFQSEINVFQNELFWPVQSVLNDLCYLVVVISLMFSLGPLETAISMTVIFGLIS